MKTYKEILIKTRPFNSDILTSVLWELELSGIKEDDDCLTLYCEEESNVQLNDVNILLEKLKGENLITYYESSEISFEDKNWNEEKIKSSVNELLDNFDEGELFVEEVYSENIFFDDNKIKNASYDQDKGFGLRTVNNDSVNFAHNTELSDEAFSKAMNLDSLCAGAHISE